MSTPWVGTLSTIKKADLIQIAEDMGVPTTRDMQRIHLVEVIQSYMDKNIARLSNDPMFKGLYRKKRLQNATASPSDSGEDVLDIPATTKAVARRTAAAASEVAESTKAVVNKGVNKLKEAGVDPSRVPLPDSPGSALRSLRAQTNSALVAVEPAKKSIINAWKTTGKTEVTKYLSQAQHVMSNSDTLIQTMLFFEFMYILYHLYPFRELELQFPPSQWSATPWKRAVYQAFSWFPEQKLKINLPGWFLSIGMPSDFTPVKAVFTWLFTTVLPPYVMAFVCSRMPHGPVHQTRHTKPSLPKFDPLMFAIFRFFVLLFPLTTAAPDLWRATLEQMGNLQGLALAGGLTAGMILAERLGGQ